MVVMVTYSIQWNPCILGTLGTEIIGLIIEVAVCVCNWDKEHVAVIERWPQFRGLEREVPLYRCMAHIVVLLMRHV